MVTGGNKGIGYETCRQLAKEGIVVVLTARDERRGIEALEKLKEEYSSNKTDDDQILFHQLDVMDPASISSLVDFIKTKFGKLDILVLFTTIIFITPSLKSRAKLVGLVISHVRDLRSIFFPAAFSSRWDV